MLQMKSADSLPEKSLFIHVSPLCVSRPSTDWIRPTHTGEGSLQYSKSTSLHLNFIQKDPHRSKYLGIMDSDEWHIKLIITQGNCFELENINTKKKALRNFTLLEIVKRLYEWFRKEKSLKFSVLLVEDTLQLTENML